MGIWKKTEGRMENSGVRKLQRWNVRREWKATSPQPFGSATAALLFLMFLLFIYSSVYL